MYQVDYNRRKCLGLIGMVGGSILLPKLAFAFRLEQEKTHFQPLNGLNSAGWRAELSSPDYVMRDLYRYERAPHLVRI